MTKDIYSDGVLVYDRYYCSRPRTPLLVLKKTLLTVVFCVSSMIYILTQYQFPVSIAAMGAVCGASCLAFSLLFTFVRKRFAIPGLLILAGIPAWFFRGVLLERLAYFADAFLLLLEGRFLFPRQVMFHRELSLSSAEPDFLGGVLLGTVLLCIAYSLLVSACFSVRIVPLPVAAVFIALCVPRLISERLEFDLWLIPALAAFAGVCAIRKNYSGGLAVKHSSSLDYRRRMRQEEREFLKHISAAPAKKRTEMRCNYYSKYFSSAMYCAAIVSVSLLIGAAVIPSGGSIDYTGVYEFFKNLGGGSLDDQSPFEEGPVSGYFSRGGDQEENLLNIMSPGRGEREMLRVTYTGERPLYLRGDIGVDFTGVSWTTVVGSEPELWRSSGLADFYRPCENRVIAALLSASTSGRVSSMNDGLPIITSSDVNIDYLCNTNVVFLPPYTAEYSFYNSENFDVFADYAVRVSEEAGGRVNSVQCTALLPSYTNNELIHGDAAALSDVEQHFADSGCTPNDIYSSVVTEMTEEDVLALYEEYVGATYSGIPAKYREDIARYIADNLSDGIDGFRELRDSGAITECDFRYQTAAYIADYLRTHYTYSLDGGNRGSNPVMQFLNETRTGHCSLYASAMTLILRGIGIPARYCTGFYVEAQGKSHSVLLREKNLHAWVEVYAGQFGWVTFDPTSSAAYPDRTGAAPDTSEPTAVPEPTSEPTAQTEPAETTSESAQAQTEQVHEPAVKPDLPAQQPVHTAEAGTAEAEAGPGFWEIAAPFIPAAVGVLAAAGVIAAVLIYFDRAVKSAKRALKSLRADSPDNGKRIFDLILALLERSGITPRSGEMPGDFWNRADQRFGTELSGMTPVLEAMEFGGHSDGISQQLYGQLDLIITSLKVFRFPVRLGLLKIIRKFAE